MILAAGLVATLLCLGKDQASHADADDSFGIAVWIRAADGASSVAAQPGEVVRFRVEAELIGASSLGLASFCFDLSAPGLALAPLERPFPGALDESLEKSLDAFFPPLGFVGPAGFGGLAQPDGLVEVGAAQNTLVRGAVTGLALEGAPLVLATGALNAPTEEGSYRVSLAAMRANALVETDGGQACEPVSFARSTPLWIVVGDPPEGAPAAGEPTLLDLRPDEAALARAGRGARGYQPRPGEPLPGLASSDLERFERGRAAFLRLLKKEEGLGPAFNHDGCAVCHLDPTAGGGGTLRVLRFGRAGPPFDGLGAAGGDVLQERGIVPSAVEYVPPEADIWVRRLTTPLFGLGLVDRIADADLLARASDDSSASGARAQIAVPLEGGPARVGRFGWKSQHATLLSFTADAALNELGLTSRYLPEENAPGGDHALLARMDRVPDPEDVARAEQPARIELWHDFQARLAPPPQTPRGGMRGAVLFEAVGCARCHVPVQRTTADPNAAFSEIVFQPYSDFLLHDMGGLGDGIVQGIGEERYMRTAPLWGLRLRRLFLHDGRAGAAALEERMEQAIEAHDGDALASRQAYETLFEDQRALLLAFLGSLGRSEFDVEGDGDVDGADWLAFAALERKRPIEPDDPAAVADVDADGDFDLVDFEVWMRAARP